ncbi:2776_t:CDS:2, partial [Funneliformis geosporum]
MSTTIKSKNIFIFFFLIITLFCVPIFSHCEDYFDVLDDNAKRSVACPLIKDDLSRFSKRDDDDELKIKISKFNCDNATEETCKNVRKTFDDAARIISTTFILKNTINLDVNFTNFCISKPSLCDVKGGRVIIGGARSARNMLLLDEDDVTRFYPQSLVKQFEFKTHPEFISIDIISSFNSIVDWYFPSQKAPIRPKQRDMLYVVLHELMHGMGFFTFWGDFLVSDDPNDVLITTRPDITSVENQTVFNGFKEAAFDRLLIFNRDQTRLTKVSDKLNKFAKAGTKFKSDVDFIRKFLDSKQVNVAREMTKVTTTPESISSIPNSSEKVILETSIKPFQAGASITHVDEKTLLNTTDFLMTFIPVPGKTLKELITQVGGKGPIGPKLKCIMENLG